MKRPTLTANECLPVFASVYVHVCASYVCLYVCTCVCLCVCMPVCVYLYAVKVCYVWKIIGRPFNNWCKYYPLRLGRAGWLAVLAGIDSKYKHILCGAHTEGTAEEIHPPWNGGQSCTHSSPLAGSLHIWDTINYPQSCKTRRFSWASIMV